MSERKRSPSKSSPSKSSSRRRSSSRSPRKSPRSQSIDQGQSSQGSEESGFDELFDSFCKFGDRMSEDIALRNVDKWFKQADLFTDKMTSTDTAIAFSKIAKNKKKLTKDEFIEMLDQLAEEKGITTTDIQTRLQAAGKPSCDNITRPIRGSIAADNMERLTNPTGYTGTHRERFDSEGRGLGLSGRYDVTSADGYVQGYKNRGSFALEDANPNPDPDPGKK